MEMLSQWYRSAKQFPIYTMGLACVVIALTIGIIAFYPRTYRSRAQLLLRIGHENMTVDPTVEAAGQTVQMQLTRKNDIQTALQVMHSRALFAAVVDQLGADVILHGLQLDDASAPKSAPGFASRLKAKIGGFVDSIDPISDRERAIGELSSALSVSSASEASVVTAEYRAKSPETAQRVVAVWLDAYLIKNAELHRTSGSHEFFQAEEIQLLSKLDETYRLIRDAKTSYGLVTVTGQQNLLEGQLATVRTSLIETEAMLAGSKARIGSLQATLAETDDRMVTDEVSGKANEAHDSMRGRLFDLEVLEREYAAKFKPDHPRLVTIQDQLAEAQKIVAQQREDRAEVTSGINPVYQRLQQELLLEKATELQHKQRRVALITQKKQLKAETAALNQTEEVITAMERQAMILEERYVNHSKRLDQSRIDEALREKRITSVNIIQPASLEERPVTPDKRLTAGFGILALIASVIGLPLVLSSGNNHAAVSDSDATLPHSENPTTSLGQEPLLHPMFDDESDGDGSDDSSDAVGNVAVSASDSQRVPR